MKLISKRAVIGIFTLAVVCLISRYVLCYWCGYYQESFAPIGLQELFAFFGLVLILAAFITWIVSLIKKQQRIWTTTLLAALFSLWGLKYILPWPHDLILYGLRDGMLRNYGLDDMRRFARDCNQLPDPPVNDVDWYTKFYWNRRVDDDLSKTKLKDKYLFLANCEDVVEFDNKVHVDWGGFENHWGFSVEVSGKKIDISDINPQARHIRVADDIVFYSDY
jgi:hypothetical protein